MRAHREFPSALTELANAQAGVVSREQVRFLGVTDAALERMLREGWWRQIARGMYHTAPTDPTWNGLAWAGVLIGGDRARLGAEASGFLHNLVDEAPRPVDVLVPVGRSARVGGEWRFSRERPGARSARSVNDPPRLTVEDRSNCSARCARSARIALWEPAYFVVARGRKSVSPRFSSARRGAIRVLDLSASVGEGDVVASLATAVQQRKTTPRRLLAAMNERSRYRHRQLVADILGDVAAGAESPLEMRYLHDVERPHGLPRGDRQRSRRGLPYASDVGYDDYQVLVELDGRKGHEGVGLFRDMKRDNQFALIEWITLRYGWYDTRYDVQPASPTAGARGWASRRLGKVASDEGGELAGCLSECH